MRRSSNIRKNPSAGLTRTPDAGCVYWFAGTRYLGRSEPDEPLLWQAAPGVTRLTAVDDLGRASSVRVVAESLPE